MASLTITRTGFHSLPTEILEIILSDSVLTDSEFFGLALLSRRLNSLAIPKFLEYHGIHDPMESFVAGVEPPRVQRLRGNRGYFRRRDSLAGLAIGFDLTSIDTFTCTIFPCRPTTPTLIEFHRLFQVLQRLDRIRHVRIVLDMTGSFVDSCTWLTTPKWRDIMEELLNAFTRTGCESFIVENRGYCWESTPYLTTLPSFLYKARCLVNPRPTRGPHLALMPYRDRVKFWPWGAKRPKLRPIPLAQDARSDITQLKSLQISCVALLRPPYSYWTYSILDQSPSLTSLTISNLSIVSMGEKMWKATLPWLFLAVQGKLRELVIHNCSALPTKELLEGIVRLKELRHLRLTGTSSPAGDCPESRTFQSKIWKWASKENFLPNLVSLHAHPEWINLIFPPNKSTALMDRRPRFTTLGVLPKTLSYCRRSIHSSLDSVFSNPTFSHLLHPYGSEENLGTPISNPRIIVDLATTEYLSWDFNHDLEAFKIMATSTSEIPLPYFAGYSKVTDLTIRIQSVVHHWNLIEQGQGLGPGYRRIVEFLGYWKGLRRLEIVGYGQTSSSSVSFGGRCDCGGDCGDFDDLRYDEEDGDEDSENGSEFGRVRSCRSVEKGRNGKGGAIYVGWKGWRDEDERIVEKLIEEASCPFLRRVVIGKRAWEVHR
ncbi:hypothetical protein BDN72DRAFT_849991 [Pluteus cervinus]|uniref:Uncharacterized protein n=1 Tax=Pluteus cervinus TaxID=181527 RepID=A0ACD3A5E2_9AGAR|nr:hypothetical protein BDN72DRAFT_849991 [Pluteus cervinus]